MATMRAFRRFGWSQASQMMQLHLPAPPSSTGDTVRDESHPGGVGSWHLAGAAATAASAESAAGQRTAARES